MKPHNVAENSRFEKLNNVEFFWIFEATNYCLILLIQRAFINWILGRAYATGLYLVVLTQGSLFCRANATGLYLVVLTQGSLFCRANATGLYLVVLTQRRAQRRAQRSLFCRAYAGDEV